jgi:hypothetical protein
MARRSFPTLAVMQLRPLAFDEVAKRLEPVLAGLPPKVIAVDGRAGAGKTSLSRFLAWYFNSFLLELDLFLTEPVLSFRHDEIRRIIDFRRQLRRPIFVEGLVVLDVLAKVEVEPDFLVHVRNSKHPLGWGLKAQRDDYEIRYAPEKRADYIVEVQHDG